MATIQQIDANRQNSQLSTGPRTDEGKQRAAANALKTGIHAESHVILSERREDLEALTADYYAHYRPTSPEVRALVDSLVHNEWILRRLRFAEAAIFNCDCPQCHRRYDALAPVETISCRLWAEESKLALMQRRINATERNYHRSLKALQTLEPPPEPAAFPQTDSPQGSLREDPVASLPREQLQPDPHPEPQDSKPASEKLGSFRHTGSPEGFLRENSASPCLRVESTPDPRPNPQPSYPKPLEQPPL